MLELLTEYFVLRTTDLVELIYGDQFKTKQASVRRTTKLLAEQGLIKRFSQQNIGQEFGQAPKVCGLSAKGVSLYGGKSIDDYKYRRTLDHESEISQFHIAVSKFCAAHNLTLDWNQDDLTKGVFADAYFSITGTQTNDFFLEIERQYMSDNLIKKATRYFEYYDTPQCEKDWGFRKFRVIFVHQTHARAKHFLKVLEKDYKNRMFWLTTKNDPLTFQTPKGDTYLLSDL